MELMYECIVIISDRMAGMLEHLEKINHRYMENRQMEKQRNH